MFMTLEHQEILRKHKRTELLAMYRKALAAIAKMNLKNLAVEVSASFGVAEFSFQITVFDPHGDNKTFYIYDFHELPRSIKFLGLVIGLVKTDDFAKVKKAKAYANSCALAAGKLETRLR